jgi:hypothetical protein
MAWEQSESKSAWWCFHNRKVPGLRAVFWCAEDGGSGRLMTPVIGCLEDGVKHSYEYLVPRSEDVLEQLE